MDYMSAVFGRTRLPLLEYKRFDKKVYAHVHTYIYLQVSIESDRRSLFYFGANHLDELSTH